MPKINFVLPKAERGWVMEKMVRRTVDALNGLCQTTVSEVEDDNADVNHWAHYLDLWRHRMDRPSSGKPKTSFWVTHVDDPFKLKIVRKLCAAGSAAICLSSNQATGKPRNAGDREEHSTLNKSVRNS